MKKLTRGEVAQKLVAAPLIEEALRRPTARDVRLLTLYGITEREYYLILKKQGGVCAICLRPPRKLRLAAEHDHKTGVLRGLVCMRSNKGLALMGDDPHNLRRAAAYLERNPAEAALGYRPVGRAGRSTRWWRTKRERQERMRAVAWLLTSHGFSVPRSVSRWIP